MKYAVLVLINANSVSECACACALVIVAWIFPSLLVKMSEKSLEDIFERIAVSVGKW